MWAFLILLAAMAFAGFKVYEKYGTAPAAPPAAAVVAAQPPAPAGPPPQLVSEKELVKLRRLARDSEHAGERASFLSKLLAVKDPEATKMIAAALATDTEAEVRVKAVGMLYDSGDKDRLTVFLRALIDEDMSVRLAVLDAIERIGDVTTAPRIAEVASSDLEPQVRVAALRVLGSLHDKARATAEAKAQKQREDYENAVKERHKKERLQ